MSSIEELISFPLVLERPLYSPLREDPISMIGLIGYMDLDHAVVLHRNRRALSEDQNEFRALLIHLKNGDMKLPRWELSSS